MAGRVNQTQITIRIVTPFTLGKLYHSYDIATRCQDDITW